MFNLHWEPSLKIGIVGLGLIGGSLAKAIKKYTDHLVYGCDANEQTVQDALEWGAIDYACSPDQLGTCDILFLALYPQQTVTFLNAHIDVFKEGCIVMDLCGVKRYLQKHLRPLCRAHRLIYIGGHPMAGKECWGFDSADAELFFGASMIVTPFDDTPPASMELLTNLFADVGFENITTTTPQAHDSMIAFTSQLAHVVSSAYIKSPHARQHKGFSAGSYKDLTRVAKLNAPMWTELFLENADDLNEEIDSLIVHLQQYRDAIAASDAQTLCALLDDGRKIKEELDA